MLSLSRRKHETNEEFVQHLFNKTIMTSPEDPDLVFITLSYSLPYREPMNDS